MNRIFFPLSLSVLLAISAPGHTQTLSSPDAPGKNAIVSNRNPGGHKGSMTNASTNVDYEKAKSNLKAIKTKIKELRNSSRASKHFEDNFESASNVGWSKSDNILFASFTSDSVKTRVAYSKNGGWLSTIEYLPVSKPPREVRQLAKSEFKKETFRQAFHIENLNMDYYIIMAEDAKTIEQLAVYNGEVFLTRQLRKAE